MPLVAQLKSLGDIWGSIPSTISQLPDASFHSMVKLVPAVKLTFVMVGTGGGAIGVRCMVEGIFMSCHAYAVVLTC